jgi:hypothetical protein
MTLYRPRAGVVVCSSATAVVRGHARDVAAIVVFVSLEFVGVWQVYLDVRVLTTPVGGGATEAHGVVGDGRVSRVAYGDAVVFEWFVVVRVDRGGTIVDVGDVDFCFTTRRISVVA